jgi:hypothetical protein
MHDVGYHGYTLWLFTVSDHKPLVYPMTVTGLLNLFAGTTLKDAPVQQWSSFAILSRFPSRHLLGMVQLSRFLSRQPATPFFHLRRPGQQILAPHPLPAPHVF